MHKLPLYANSCNLITVRKHAKLVIAFLLSGLITSQSKGLVLKSTMIPHIQVCAIKNGSHYSDAYCGAMN